MPDQNATPAIASLTGSTIFQSRPGQPSEPPPPDAQGQTRSPEEEAAERNVKINKFRN